MSPSEIKSAREALFAALEQRGRDPFPTFARAWALTVLPFAAMVGILVLFPDAPAAWIATALVAGFTQNALGVFMHEGCHLSFHRRKAANDVWANLFVCLPVFNTVEGYRAGHFDHHLRSGTPEDPYHYLYAGYPSRGHILRSMVLDLVGVTAVRAFVDRYVRPPTGAKVRQPRYALAAFVLIHAALAAMLWAVTGRWWAYGVLWLLPLLTIPITINRLRTVVEHYTASDHGTANRTTLPGWIEYLCIAPYGYSHHFEHHLWPQVPYFDLAFAHRFLVERGQALGEDEVNSHGYLRTFWHLVATSEPAAKTHEG